MRFNESDTLLILFLLKNIQASQTSTANLNLLINKLDFKFNDDRDLQFAGLLKSIKFKATPR